MAWTLPDRWNPRILLRDWLLRSSRAERAALEAYRQQLQFDAAKDVAELTATVERWKRSLQQAMAMDFGQATAGVSRAPAPAVPSSDPVLDAALQDAAERRARLILDAALRLKQVSPEQTLEACVAEAERVWDWLVPHTRELLLTRSREQLATRECR